MNIFNNTIEMSNSIKLAVYIFILFCQAICAPLNGFIIYLFIRRKEPRQNKSLRLIVFLSLGDFLLAIGGLPYVIYVTVNWNPIQLDYDPWFMMMLAQPLPLQLKVSAIITGGIALGRSIVFGLMTVFLSASIFLKLRVVAKQKGSLNSHQGQNKYMKAHRTSTGILMSSLLFLTLPSVCVGIVELMGFSVFKLIGAFYLACLLVSGEFKGNFRANYNNSIIEVVAMLQSSFGATGML
ncbi:hypothetical protein B9Z55_017703 [Caenorhabditis nigoni]|uniref:Uncharacterized protein n=1 Tax=Caenorhabditis nigoni TaxID=1611254 RepID=A0A2G5TAQ3_9PELO|nr:hypothetical protein B9Z55_017703 [Caenorhabditis nigoni]